MLPDAGPPQPALPPRYRALAAPLGIVGAVKIEASPWVEDNLWVLEVAERDTIVVGVVGNLEPGKPDFAEMLARYHKNPLFRGIRYGNLWGRDITKEADNPAFIDGLRLLAQADLVLDTANPRVDLLQAIVRITDKVPDLRVVLDHLPSLDPRRRRRQAYDAALAELRKRPQIYVKLSAVIHRVNGQVSTELAPYRDRLDQLVATFGEDRILFGSDWPNSDGVAPHRQGGRRRARVLHEPAARGRGEVLLEELGRRLQVDQARAVAAAGALGSFSLLPSAFCLLPSPLTREGHQPATPDTSAP